MGRFPTSVKVVDVQKRRAPSKHYVSACAPSFSVGHTSCDTTTHSHSQALFTTMAPLFVAFEKNRAVLVRVLAARLPVHVDDAVILRVVLIAKCPLAGVAV